MTTRIEINKPRQLTANTAALAAGHPYGAAAGLELLQGGGNAIDAAVAAMIALSVVVPGSVGLGGYGGSAVVYIARTRRTIAVDFDSCAPLAFRDGVVTGDPQSNYYGARAVTVPAVVAGLALILSQFGTKSWSDVSQPAIRLAEQGVVFDSEHKRYLDRCAPKFDPQSLATLFAHVSRSSGSGAAALPEIGDLWKQPELAQLLRRLADVGPRAFYEGEIARTVVQYLQERDGILTDEDFRAFKPRIVDAVQATVHGFDLVTPPPPSGGITALAIIQTVDRLLSETLEPWSAPYFHRLAEATKSCWQERYEFFGDPNFVDIPIDNLLSEKVADARAERIKDGVAKSVPNIARFESPHTANVLAVDGDRNMISLTATQGWMYGAHLVVDGLGLVLNHGMSRFDYRPGHPNAPAAGKRMQHNMAPMIVLPAESTSLSAAERNGTAFAYGMPGGPKIVNVTAQLAINTLMFESEPAAAIVAPRLHCEVAEPLQMSVNTPDDVVAGLEQMGHTIRREEDMGGPVNVLAIDTKTGKIDVASGEATGAVAGY